MQCQNGKGRVSPLNGQRMGALDLRTPEEQFAGCDDVQERFDQPIESAAIDREIDTFLRAWQARDGDAACNAGTDLIRLTRSHFESQGVPVFAHPIVPPQFIDRVVAIVRQLPQDRQRDAASDIVDCFPDSAQAGVDEEFFARLNRRPSLSHGRAQRLDMHGASGCGCSNCGATLNQQVWRHV